jgi:hypothetical protein
MRSIACLCLISLALMPSARADEKGWMSLFDGKSLLGWTRFGGKAEAWAVENGCLVSLGEGGGWLGTTRDYADFELKLEFLVTSGSNSGVYLHAPADTSHISRTGMEIQILDETHPKHAKIQGWQKTGAVYHIAAPKPGFQKAVGEWNTMEIKLVRTEIEIKLNGHVIVQDRLDSHPELTKEHTGLARNSGRIGLQSHNGRVEFRGIKVKDLGSSISPARK